MEEQAQALQESERKLTAAARLALLGYWEIDVVANRVSWSEESARILGLPPTERTRSWDEFLQLVYPEDRPIIEECRARIVRGDPAGRVALRLVLPDGTIRHTETTGETVMDESSHASREAKSDTFVSPRTAGCITRSSGATHSPCLKPFRQGNTHCAHDEGPSAPERLPFALLITSSSWACPRAFAATSSRRWLAFANRISTILMHACR